MARVNRIPASNDSVALEENASRDSTPLVTEHPVVRELSGTWVGRAGRALCHAVRGAVTCH